MKRVVERALAIAPVAAPVVLLGETGTGKEVLARAIHAASPRARRPFVPVNCGAIPDALLESELFGHARGAFTGAATARPGLFEEAEGGTLFLDEVGELPLPTQVKLNRALQEKEIRRVGENQPVKVDVRIIAATHRDLRAEAAAGRFREDLFYRLHVFPVRLPSLRERVEDVPLLAAHFLEKHARAFRREVSQFEPDALKVLTAYSWPGNVRELENVIERAVAVSKGQHVAAEDLPAELSVPTGGAPSGSAFTSLPYRDALEQVRERFSREYLVGLMREFKGNVTKAAERARMERETLHRLLKKHGVRGTSFRKDE